MSSPDFTFTIKGGGLKAEGELRLVDGGGRCPIFETVLKICRMVLADVPKFGALDAVTITIKRGKKRSAKR